MKNTSNRNGYSIIEVMMVIAMFGVVLTIANLFWQYTYKNNEFVMTQYRLTDTASTTVTSIAHELKAAQDAMDGAYPLELANDNELIFYSDIDYDMVVERVHYWVANNNLMRGVVEPSGDPPGYVNSTEKSKIVIDSISPTHAPIFTYYNGNWPGSAVNNPLPLSMRLLETRMIEIKIPITIKDSSGSHIHTEQTVVQMRNLKDNL